MNLFGSTTIILTKVNTSVPPIIPTNILLTGKYSSSITNDPDIVISLNSDNSVDINNGCNLNPGKYSATSDGRIIFKDFITTSLVCTNDFDRLYVTAFRNSVTFERSGNQIILRDINRIVTMVLTPLSADVIQLPLGKYRTSLTFNQNILV
jgi:heat shock protein HslJ